MHREAGAHRPTAAHPPRPSGPSPRALSDAQAPGPPFLRGADARVAGHRVPKSSVRQDRGGGEPDRDWGLEQKLWTTLSWQPSCDGNYLLRRQPEGPSNVLPSNPPPGRKTTLRPAQPPSCYSVSGEDDVSCLNSSTETPRTSVSGRAPPCRPLCSSLYVCTSGCHRGRAHRMVSARLARQLGNQTLLRP